MKNISAALKAHLQQEVTTLCTCWKVTRTDGLIFGFTDCATNVIFENIIYSASTGQNSSNIKTTAALNVDNLDVVGNLGNVENSFNDVIDAPFLTEEDIRAGLWDLAAIEIFMVNYNDLSMGKLILRKGTLGEIKTGRSQFTAELRGMTQPLQQFIGRLFTPSCDANLGDSRCKININAVDEFGNFKYKANGSVVSKLSQHGWIDSSLTQTNSTQVSSIQNIAADDNVTIIQSNNHGFTAGTVVTLSGITGAMSGLNGLTVVISYIDINTFSFSFDSSVFLYLIPGSNPQKFENSSYSNKFVAKYENGTWNTDGGNYIGGGSVALSVPSEFFQGGLVTWTSGLNIGLKMEVKNYYPGYVFLVSQMPYEIVDGDTYVITAGCDKRDITCNARFNNIINFRGFNLVPGNDRLMSGQ